MRRLSKYLLKVVKVHNLHLFMTKFQIPAQVKVTLFSQKKVPSSTQANAKKSVLASPATESKAIIHQKETGQLHFAKQALALIIL